MNIRVPLNVGISWLAENRLASQERLCPIEFISVLNIIPRFYVPMLFQTKVMKRYSLPSSAEIKDEWICTSVCLIRLHICYRVLSGCSLLSNRHKFHIIYSFQCSISYTIRHIMYMIVLHGIIVSFAYIYIYMYIHYIYIYNLFKTAYELKWKCEIMTRFLLIKGRIDCWLCNV